MKPRSLTLIVSLLALSPLLAAAAAPFSIFSAKSGLADGWKTSAWTGPVVNQADGETKGATVLQITLGGDAKEFCGIALSASAGSGLDLTDKLRESGVVEIRLKPGKTEGGQTVDVVQPLQFALSFLTKDGETVHANFNVQTKLVPSAPESTVTITLPQALKGVKDPTQLASVSGLRIQYLGAALAGFSVIDCTIKD
jgi:hypothetical protein